MLFATSTTAFVLKNVISTGPRNTFFSHSKRHPAEMGSEEISQFLTHLAVKKKVAASTQTQAFSAILFLYKYILKKDLDLLENVTRAKKPTKLPVVFTKEEVRSILLQLGDTQWLMANLVYGSGLRLGECLKLRMKDIDFGYGQIAVRNGKGNKDRITMLPAVYFTTSLTVKDVVPRKKPIA